MTTVTTVTSASGGTLNIANTGIVTPAVNFTGNMNLLKTNTGTITLNTAQFYTGTTEVNGGQILVDLANSLPTSNLIPASNTLVLSGGTIAESSKANVGVVQNFATTVLNPGASAVVQNGRASSGSENMSVGTLVRNVGSTVDFTNPNTGTAGNNISTTTANGDGGILGGWATFGGTEFARNNGGNVLGGATYTAITFGAGINTNMTASLDNSATPDATTSSIRFNTAAATSLTLAGNNTVTTGGILVTATTAANASLITGGSITSGNGQDLIIIQNDTNAAGLFTIASNIVDPIAGGSISLTKSGAGVAILTGVNTFTGPVYLNAGQLRLGTGGSIPVTDPIIDRGTLAFGDNASALPFSNAISGTGGVTQVGTGTTTLNGVNSFTGTVAASAGKLIIGNNGAVPNPVALNISGGGSIALSTGMNALKISTLTISGTSTVPTASLDVKNSGIAISYATAAAGATLTTTTYQQVIAARGVVNPDTGISDYSGKGITSTTAAANNQAAFFDKFGVGVINNADLDAIQVNSPYSTFLGTAVTTNSVLARYTYMGDINLDGKIDIDDYNYIDAGFEGALPGFSGLIIGDFNNDGIVNIDDYNIIDTGFGFQGSPLSDGGLTGLGGPAVGISAVPEPTSLLMLGLGAAGLLARRRRR